MKKKIILTLLSSAAFVASSQAAVIVQDSYLDSATGSNDGTTFTLTTADMGLSTASSVDKIVVGFSMRRNESVTASFGTTSMTAAEMVFGGTNDGTAAIWYIDNPSLATLGGDLTITAGDGNSDFGSIKVYAFLLSGTAAGVADSNSYIETTDDPRSISVASAGDGFGLAAVGRNGGLGGVSDPYRPTPAATAEKEGAQSWIGYWDKEPGSTYSIEVEGNDHTGAIAYFAAIPELAGIPEPSTALLGGIGCMLLLHRRRQS